jgi:hypothetical protein
MYFGMIMEKPQYFSHLSAFLQVKHALMLAGFVSGVVRMPIFVVA